VFLVKIVTVGDVHVVETPVARGPEHSAGDVFSLGEEAVHV